MNTTCSPALRMRVTKTTVSTTFLSPGSATSKRLTPSLSSLFFEFSFIHYDGPFLIFFIACRFVGGLQRDLISGQLYSCPTRYQLSYSTLLTELCHTLNCSPVLHMRVTTELQSQQHFHLWGLLQVKVLVAIRPPFLNCLFYFFL
jgi:hypothetical protein